MRKGKKTGIPVSDRSQVSQWLLIDIERAHTRVQCRINDLLRRPQLRCHGRDAVLLVRSNEVLGVFETGGRNEHGPSIIGMISIRWESLNARNLFF